ncbi:MAG: hypothetical protein IPM98_05340 [Lewinellaceae bacterium]|nr:hypothetical protein [Lewinellaceae bacterium]
MQYPHGCIEQTTSAAFPQLFVDILTPLSQKQKDRIARNINAAIGKMQNFQQTEGGFSYWPGGGGINDWSSSCGSARYHRSLGWLPDRSQPPLEQYLAR